MEDTWMISLLEQAVRGLYRTIFVEADMSTQGAYHGPLGEQ
jgi:hypothetical protein